jgi:hypothetical protein
MLSLCVQTNAIRRTLVVFFFFFFFSSSSSSSYSSILKSSQSPIYVTTDDQSASLTWNKAHIWGLRPDLYYCMTVSLGSDPIENIVFSD